MTTSEWTARGWTAERWTAAVEAAVHRSTAEQGLPPRVEDEAAIERVARMLEPDTMRVTSDKAARRVS